MKHVLLWAVFAACASFAGHAQEGPAPRPFTSGSRYAAVGDSITHHGAYPIYLEAFYRTRFPSMEVEFLNLGISGDTVSGSLERYPWDIQHGKATVVSVLFGMNDISRSLYASDQTGPEIERQRSAKIDEYEANLRRLIAKLRQDGAEIILITPTIYDDTSTISPPSNFSGVNRALALCGERVQRIGAEEKIPVMDFHKPMRDLSAQIQSQDTTATLVALDRTHPGPPGHLFMAALFLKSQGLSGDFSRIAINAEKASLTESYHCHVENIQGDKNRIRFRYLADGLPFPVEKEASPALKWFPIVEEFNRQLLIVTGLEPGDYALKIDGQLIRTLSSEELASGVNLAAEAASPEVGQAFQVLSLIKQRADLVRKQRDIVMVEFQAARNLPRPISLSDIQPLLDARLKNAAGGTSEPFIRRTGEEYLVNKPNEAELARKAGDLATRIYAAAKPKPHQVEIIRVN